MKYIDIEELESLQGRILGEEDTFCFQCHSGLSCFNQCCRNLNLFLHPYDVLRLKRNLNISSEVFLDTYVDLVLREGIFFPEVVFRMSENSEKTCVFLTESGCSVYPDRPDTCRTFPMERGALYDAESGETRLIHFFRPPDFCQGQFEDKEWTPRTWYEDQDAILYNQMTLKWSEIKRLFIKNPFGAEGPEGKKAKMAFMATYNTDQFREFILNSSFLKRYRVKFEMVQKLKRDDLQLLKFGFDWVKFILWGIRSSFFSVK